MLRIALLTALVGYLPGALIFRLPVGGRSHASLPAEERLFWHVILSVAWSSIVGLGLAAAGVYRFNTLLSIDVVLCVVLAGLLRIGVGRVLWGPPPEPGPKGPGLPHVTTPKITWTALVPAGIALLGSLTIFAVPPAEYIMGGKDPGVYMNEGIQIAQRGGLVIADELAKSIRPEHRELIYPQRRDPSYFSIRFMGFFVLNPDEGAVVGQFPHLYPTWIAIAYGINGLSGARWVIGVWAILGLLAVYFTGARLFGRAAAAAGTGLLAIHVLQVWYGRYPNAEIVMQALVFAGTLAFVRAHVDGHRLFAPLAGILFSLSVFAHITGLFAVAAIVVAAFAARLEGQRWLAGFAVPLVAGTGLALAYLAIFLPPYFALPLTFVRYLGALEIAALVGAFALFIVAWRFVQPQWAGRWRTPGLALLIAAAWIVTGYAYVLRRAGGTLAPHDADALRTFTTFYLSPLGLGAALVGLTMVTWRRFRDSAAFLAVVTTFAVVFFYKTRIVPEHFWAGRRFVAVILPGLCLLIGAAAFSGLPAFAERSLRSQLRRDSLRSQLRPGSIARAAVGALLIAALGWHFWAKTRPILRHVEYAGLIPRLEQMAGAFGDDDLVLFETRGVADTHVLALPLAYVYARNVMVFAPADPDGALLREFVLWADAHYRRVLFVGGGGMEMPARSVGFTPVGSGRFWIPEYESLRNTYPRRSRLKEFDVGIYEMKPEPDNQDGFDLDIGEGDALYLRGFHADEVHPSGARYRWTRHEASVAIRGTMTEGRLTIWMGAGGRPPTARAPLVDISINGQRIGSVTVGNAVAPYEFTIPPDILKTTGESQRSPRIAIATSTWNPAQLLKAKDDRDLGVMVDRLSVR